MIRNLLLPLLGLCAGALAGARPPNFNYPYLIPNPDDPNVPGRKTKENKMKRLLVSIMVALCTCDFALASTADEHHDRYAAVDIAHPTLAKVFPGLQFQKKEIITESDLIIYEVNTSFHGRKWRMPQEFNLLIAEFKDQTKASVDERLESFVLMYYWSQGGEICISSRERISQQLWYHFNWRFIGEVQSKNWPQKVTVEVIIAFDGQQILEMQIKSQDGPRGIFTPLLLKYQGGSMTDEVGLVISGPHVEYVREQDFRFSDVFFDQYYVQVSQDHNAICL